MEPINDFRDSKVGDAVSDPARGVGVIINIDNCDSYPVYVRFPNNKVALYYSLDGRLFDRDTNPSLFKGELEFLITHKTIKKPVKKYLVVFKEEGCSAKCSNDFYPNEETFRKENKSLCERLEWVQLIEKSEKIFEE